MRSRMLALLSLTLSATACAPGSTETQVRTVHDYCLLANGISYSQQAVGQTETAGNLFDSEQTVTQVIAHNITWTRTCSPAVPTPEE